MKYTQLFSYKKHLQSAYPDHFSPYYGVAIVSDYERKTLIQGTIRYMRIPLEEVKTLSLEETGFQEVEQELFSQSLFSDQDLIVIDFAEKLSSNELKRVFQSNRHLLFGFSKNSPHIRQIEGEGVILDLLSEKPWDRKKRWAEQLYLKTRSAKKAISEEVIDRLMVLFDEDFASMNQGMDKLLSYAAQKQVITPQDLEAVCENGQEMKVKEFVDQIVWGFSQNLSEPKKITADFFFSWLYKIREEMRLGLQMQEVLLANPSANLVEFFPRIWPKTLERKKNIVQKKDLHFFSKALQELYSLEMMAKDQSPNYHALIETFRGKL